MIFSRSNCLWTFVTIACAAIPSVTQADDGYQPLGPIALRNMRPYNLLFMQFRPELPDVLEAGHSKYGVQLDLANNMLLPANTNGVQVIEDNEIDRLNISWTKGIGHHSEVSAFVPILYRNGGIMDELMNGWHRFFGIPSAIDDPNGRTSYPPYRSILFLTDSLGNPIVNQGNAFGLGDVSATVKRQFVKTKQSSVAGRVGVSLPTGNSNLILGNGGVNLGFDVDGSYRLGRYVNLFTNIGYVITSHSSPVPHTRTHMTQYVVGAEWIANSRDSYIAQIDGNSIAVWTGNQIADRAPVTATFGYKRRVSDRMVISGAISENGDYHAYTIPTLGNIGPDFTVSLGVEWRR